MLVRPPLGVAAGELALDTAEAVDCALETVESAGLLAICWIPVLSSVYTDVKDAVEYFDEHFSVC
jgi:hypothetical protein